MQALQTKALRKVFETTRNGLLFLISQDEGYFELSLH